ncbi:AAA family ATPase [Vibrio sp. WXL103]|uniref:AAA family ATPase n=1 Tax=Vibrio sp. WXL103 TaxID=3450710 RepID=UPI003EC8ADB0
MSTALLEKFKHLEARVNSQVIGQANVVRQLIITLLADGHALLEGMPGLAKTRVAREIASCMRLELGRVQFTPDMLPADITGSEVLNTEQNSLSFRPGPIFTQLLLADEINRAPAKVQSALLEAMAENQVTVGGNSYPLPSPFMVMATQNPIEQAGTFPLPEAQLDRFLTKIVVGYPDKQDEIAMLNMLRGEEVSRVKSEHVVSLEDITQAKSQVKQVHVSPAVDQYIVDLVNATRYPQTISAEFAQWLELGASPRASIALDKAARAHAWLNGQDYVAIDNVQAVAVAVLSHRIKLSYQAVHQGNDAVGVCQKLLQAVAWV